VTCIEIPWVPYGDPAVRRFINEIVRDEESDQVWRPRRSVTEEGSGCGKGKAKLREDGQ